ncbi:response regulator [Sphingobacterium sp. LRF_L2]|uniref:response regulator n=1 Tax=Sphingobacterium sp. LRF_L2 TaxID=3369421 RepID=UPI003F5FBBAE
MGLRKVFLCDDDPSILDVLEMIVQFAGAEAIIERDSAKLYERMLTTKPDILIVDLWMPNLSGDEVIKRVKADDFLKQTYVVCISASRDGKEVAMNAGADYFLPKPFDMQDLLQIIAENGKSNRATA